MLTAYSRVTVVSGERKVDLALPSALPVSDVVPQVLRLAVPMADRSNGVAERSGQPWTLARLGGNPLPLTSTLAEAGVLDGEVLELRQAGQDVRPAFVEDVRDAVEDSVDAAGGAWTSRTTATAALLATAVLLGTVAVLRWAETGPAQLAPTDDGARLVTAGAAVAALLAATAWASVAPVAAPRWAAQLTGAVAMGWAFLLGLALGEVVGLAEPVADLVALALVALTAAVARAATAAATPHVGAAAVLLGVGLALAVGAVVGYDADQVRRAAPVLAVLTCGVLPRLSLSVGGLASADYRVRHAGRLPADALGARYRQSNDLLLGGLIALSLVIVWGGVWTATSEAVWDPYLAASVAVAALLRSRVFSRVQHLLPLRVAGLVVLAVLAVELCGRDPGLAPWTLLVLVAVAVAAVALAYLPMSDITRARVKRTLNLVEFFVVVDMVVVAAGALGVFARVF